MNEKELLELDYDDYIKECYKVYNKHKELLDLNMGEIICMEAFYNIIRVFASYPEAGLYCQNLIHGA